MRYNGGDVQSLPRKEKILLVAVISFFIILLGAGGYLLWRVNQPETIAPDDSEAADECSDYLTNEGPSITDGSGCTSCSENGKSVDCGSYTFKCGSRCYKQADGAKCCVAPAPTPTTYTVTYNGNGGKCTPTSRSVEKGSYAAAPSCTRTGHTIQSFSRTSGSGGTLNSTTGGVTNVTGNQTITANWKAESYTVEYKAGEHGKLEGATTQTIEHGSSGTPVTAVPDEGYLFAEWDDKNTDNPRTDKEVTANKTITAIFSLSCGNGVCDEGENAQNCPKDCPARCGDGFCTHDETNETCPEDCGYAPSPSPAPVGPSVPETGIFDDSKTAIIAGLLFIFLGLTWVSIGRGMTVSIGFLGKTSKELSKKVEDSHRKRKIDNEIRKGKERKDKFERKIEKKI